MHSDKKLSKEDTWRPDDLRRHLREGGLGDGHARRRDDSERKHRGGESTERRHRDPEKESRRERDTHRERESTSKRREEDIKNSYVEKRKEGSRDRRGDKERDRREVRDKDTERRKERHKDDYEENRDRRRDGEERHEREREKERTRDKERDRERRNGEDGDRRREERDKERTREEREHRERRRREQGGEAGRDKEQRERRREREGHREEDKRSERERHGDRKRSEHREERENREEHRRHKEERERRHKERENDEQKQRRDTESREHRGVRKSGEVEEEERHRHGDRERGDRDKHREKRHREEENPERKHRDRQHREDDGTERTHRDKTSEREKSRKPQTNAVKTEEVEITTEYWTTSVTDVGDTEEVQVVNEDDLAAQEYEDDFEDYEEDFEELDQSENDDEDGKEEEESPEVGEEKEEVVAQSTKEIEAIRRAMNEENERVGTDQPAPSTKREEEGELKSYRGHGNNQSGAPQHGRFIDFVAAKRREVSKKVASKQKKRSTELLRMIDLDFSMSVSLLDLPPVNEYDMYIRTFGAANTKQAYAQCNEDNADQDIQTEEIEACEKWTQHPPEHSTACGDPNLSESARERNANELNFDSQRLTAFLRSASQVMVVLLEEDRAEKKSLSQLRTQTDRLSFSDGSLQLNTKLPFLYGRHISLVHFSQVQKHTMMTVHAPTAKPSSVRLDSCTLICIWNIWEPSRPRKILVHESEVQCCCFSPGKATLVFAGTSVGSVALWDLREQASDHYHLKIGETDWTLRHPTFFTNAVMAAAGHFSSVSSVEVVPGAAAGALGPEVPPLASEEESSGLAFQLASLDESGVLNFWVVMELPKVNEAGSPTDLGLRPGGKVKLLHSSSLFTAESVSPRDSVKVGPLQTLHLKFLPSDTSRFFIGTNMGLVKHGTTHGLKVPPKFYRSQEAGPRPVDVTAIHFSPFRQNLFLVGCSDGSIRLHTASREQPVAEWRDSTAGEAVVSLQWTQTRPTVFCVLDSASNLHVWDLLKNDAEPVVTEKIPADSVTGMAVFGDSGKQNTYSGVALAHESGKIEMQYFTRDFTVTAPAEEEKLETMMTEAF